LPSHKRFLFFLLGKQKKENGKYTIHWGNPLGPLSQTLAGFSFSLFKGMSRLYVRLKENKQKTPADSRGFIKQILFSRPLVLAVKI
jgi:hypothetical protein